MNDHHFGLLFKQIHDAIGKYANNKLRSKDLTLMQVQVLISIYNSENQECSLKELERQFNIAQSTVAGIISRLEKKELITGFTDSYDNRVKKVRLTPYGVSCCITAEADIEMAENMMLAEFSEQEKELLYELLQKVYRTVKFNADY